AGAKRRRWLLAYPRGYAELVERHAALNGQPAALQFAIVREESGFDPLMESFANAIGLTQLTAAPAERFAEGLPHDRNALRDPAINVTIGARELGDVYGRYSGGAPVALAPFKARARRPHRRAPSIGGCAIPSARTSRSTSGWSRSLMTRRAATPSACSRVTSRTHGFSKSTPRIECPRSRSRFRIGVGPVLASSSKRESGTVA